MERSKQHYKIRLPRPLVDQFDLGKEHPEKQWWRERPLAPATFFGFPDVQKIGLRGGSLYAEQMDSVTVAVIMDKCVEAGIADPEVWSPLVWRSQQLCSRMFEPDIAYVMRAVCRAGWEDEYWRLTYTGRVLRRLPYFDLRTTGVALQVRAESSGIPFEFHESD